MMHSRTIAGLMCLLLAAGLLTACGKKGPLYLPPGKMPVIQPTPAATPATDPSSDRKAEDDREKPQTPTVDTPQP